MRSIRGGMGLGDALYVQSVARHLVSKGERLSVATKWPEVFEPLGDRVECVPFRRNKIDILAHYSLRKPHATTQWEDVRLTAGIQHPIDLALDWKIKDQRMVDRVRAQADGRPVILVQLPRAPMARTDGFGQELLPDCRALQRAVDALRGRAFLVQVGAGTPQFKFSGIDLDLADQTTVSQLFDLASACDGMLGYVSFMLPLAESLGKRALLVWSRRGLKSRQPYIARITPAKVVHRKDLVRVVMDGTDDDIEGAAHDLLR